MIVCVWVTVLYCMAMNIGIISNRMKRISEGQAASMAVTVFDLGIFVINLMALIALMRGGSF